MPKQILRLSEGALAQRNLGTHRLGEGSKRDPAVAVYQLECSIKRCGGLRQVLTQHQRASEQRQ